MAIRKFISQIILPMSLTVCFLTPPRWTSQSTRSVPSWTRSTTSAAHRRHPSRRWPDHPHRSQGSLCLPPYRCPQAHGARLPGRDPGKGVKPWIPRAGAGSKIL